MKKFLRYFFPFLFKKEPVYKTYQDLVDASPIRVRVTKEILKEGIPYSYNSSMCIGALTANSVLSNIGYKSHWARITGTASRVENVSSFYPVESYFDKEMTNPIDMMSIRIPTLVYLNFTK